MTKQELADYYNRVWNVPVKYEVSADRAYNECKRIGLTWDRTLRENSLGNQSRGLGPSKKGVFVCIRRKDRPPKDTIDPTLNDTDY